MICSSFPILMALFLISFIRSLMFFLSFIPSSVIYVSFLFFPSLIFSFTLFFFCVSILRSFIYPILRFCYALLLISFFLSSIPSFVLCSFLSSFYPSFLHLFFSSYLCSKHSLSRQSFIHSHTNQQS